MTVIEAIGSLFAALKHISPTILAAIAIASGVILFSGESVADVLGAEELRQQYRLHIGIAFLGASSFLCAMGTARVATAARKRWRRGRILAARQESLHALTPDEKAYLAPYVFGNVNTQYFQLEDGVVGGLVGKAILYQASRVGRMLTGFAYNIQPWAREYLTKKPHLLEGANPNPEGPPDLFSHRY